jgi:cell wall-associated NlpC family hydrolase
MRSVLALPIALAFALLATMFVATPPADAASRRQERIHHGFRVVKNQKGDPYVYGADGPNAFDCSGLIYYAYHKKANFRGIPRTSSAQARFARRIKRRNLRRGDFVFFYSGGPWARNVYHVGVFAGWKNGHRMIIHAPYSGRRVHRERIWTNHWFPGTLRGL